MTLGLTHTENSMSRRIAEEGKFMTISSSTAASWAAKIQTQAPNPAPQPKPQATDSDGDNDGSKGLDIKA
jgi:hypothetical protein